MFCLVICVVSESCSEQKSVETRASIPEEDITITYTSPDLDNSYRDSDIVLEKVSIPESIYSHISRDYKCEEVRYSLNDSRACLCYQVTVVPLKNQLCSFLVRMPLVNQMKQRSFQPNQAHKQRQLGGR